MYTLGVPGFFINTVPLFINKKKKKKKKLLTPKPLFLARIQHSLSSPVPIKETLYITSIKVDKDSNSQS